MPAKPRPLELEVKVKAWELACARCGERFVTRRPDRARFCSSVCRQAAYRERTQAALKVKPNRNRAKPRS